MTNPNDSVDVCDFPRHQCYQIGLTKREHFAALVMASLCGDSNCGNNIAIISSAAVVAADALIVALNKEKP